MMKNKDIIAAIVILGFVSLKIAGIDGGLDTSLALIVGYYFGHRTTGIDKGN